MKLILLFVYFHIVISQSLESEYVEKINSNTIRIEDVKYVAALIYKENKGFICTATIITEKHLLTLSTCYRKYAIYARIGSSNYRKDGKTIPVKDFIRHPKYNIAVVVLSKKINVNSRVGKISLVAENVQDPTNKLMVIYGWHREVLDSTMALRVEKKPAIDNESCLAVFPTSTEAEFCYGHTRRNGTLCIPYQYFQGGPCVYNDVLYGISSVKTYRCLDDVGKCMRVSFLRSWIEETVRKNSATKKILNISLIQFLLLIVYCLY